MAHWPPSANGLEQQRTQMGRIGGTPMQRVTITIDDELMTRARPHHRDPRLPEPLRGDPRPRPRRHPRGGGRHRHQARLRGRRWSTSTTTPRAQLPKRLTETFHDHHELSLSSLHVHLDHDSCMEVTVLRGQDRPGAALRRARDRRARRAPRPRGADAAVKLNSRACERRASICDFIPMFLPDGKTTMRTGLTFTTALTLIPDCRAGPSRPRRPAGSPARPCASARQPRPRHGDGDGRHACLHAGDGGALRRTGYDRLRMAAPRQHPRDVQRLAACRP